MYQLHFKLKTEGDDLRVAVTHADSTIKGAFFEFLKKHGHELWQRVLSVDLYSGVTDRSMELKPKVFLGNSKAQATTEVRKSVLYLFK